MRRDVALVGGCLALLFIAQGVLSIRPNAPTYDEAMHRAAGYSYLATRDFRLVPENPPLVKELLAAPLFLVHRLPSAPDAQDWTQAAASRIGHEFLYRSPISPATGTR